MTFLWCTKAKMKLIYFQEKTDPNCLFKEINEPKKICDLSRFVIYDAFCDEIVMFCCNCRLCNKTALICNFVIMHLPLLQK